MLHRKTLENLTAHPSPSYLFMDKLATMYVLVSYPLVGMHVAGLRRGR
jgi:hypothetical protein